MAKFLLSHFVDIFHADAALMSSGNIRGDRDYTYCGSILSLRALFPFSASKPIVITIPGYIIEEMITYSRRSAFLDPPRDNGKNSFLPSKVCNRRVSSFQLTSYKLTHI